MMNKNVQLKINNDNSYPVLYDSGWISVTAFYNEAGIWAANNTPPRYRRIGNIVYLDRTLKSGNAGVQFYLPNGFYPSSLYNAYAVRFGYHNAIKYLFINYNEANGAVYVEPQSFVEKGLEISLAGISFFVD